MEFALDTVVRQTVADAPDLRPFRALLQEPGRDARALTSVLEGHESRVGSWLPLRRAESGIGYDRLRLIDVTRVLTQWWGATCQALDGDAFWRHAAATGVVAAAAVADPDRANQAFVAGFAHRLGRLALDRYFPHGLQAAMTLAETEALDLVAAERELLGFTEIEVAALIGSELQLPRWLVAAIGFPAPRTPAQPYAFPGVVVTACSAASVLGIPHGTPRTRPMTPVARAYAEGVIATLRQFGGRSWVDRHVERVVAASMVEATPSHHSAA